MALLQSFLITLVLGSLVRFPAVWLVGSAFLMEEDKIKAGGIAILAATSHFVLGLIPVIGMFAGLIVGLINFSLFKSLYNSGTGGAIGAALLVETVTAGILYGIGLLLSTLGL